MRGMNKSSKGEKERMMIRITINSAWVMTEELRKGQNGGKGGCSWGWRLWTRGKDEKEDAEKKNLKLKSEEKRSISRASPLKKEEISLDSGKPQGGGNS